MASLRGPTLRKGGAAKSGCDYGLVVRVSGAICAAANKSASAAAMSVVRAGTPQYVGCIVLGGELREKCDP